VVVYFWVIDCAGVPLGVGDDEYSVPAVDLQNEFVDEALDTTHRLHHQRVISDRNAAPPELAEVPGLALSSYLVIELSHVLLLSRYQGYGGGGIAPN